MAKINKKYHVTKKGVIKKNPKKKCLVFEFEFDLKDRGFNDLDEQTIKKNVAREIIEYNKLNNDSKKILKSMQTEENMWLIRIQCFKNKREARLFSNYSGWELVKQVI